MGAAGVSVSRQVGEIYAARGDVEFSEILVRWSGPDRAELTDLIESDGRSRIRLGRAVTLRRYIDAVPDIGAQVDALDAAIDMALRSLMAQGVPPVDAVERLVHEHPELEGPVREAAALSEAILSTSSIRRVLEAPAPARALPQAFGPRLQDGRCRYELTELLGRGSAGEVYKAVDRVLSEEGHEAIVAVKILPTREGNAWDRQRFIEEATKARRVVHPNVVRVIDRGTSDKDEDFIVYEYVGGGDLQSYAAARQAMPAVEVARLVAGIARGVQAAHAAGLVHCDLKPSNIVVTPEGEPKIADFGVAVRRRGREEPDPATGSVGPVGNLAFIAPEQYRMEQGALAPPADIYAIGGIMYWLASGTLPNGDTAAQIDQTHDSTSGRKDAPLLERARPDFDGDLRAICRRCLAPAASERYASAAQVADDIDAWARREPIPWTQPSLRRVVSLWVARRPGTAFTLSLLFCVMVAAAAMTWRLLLANAAVAARETEKLNGRRRIDAIYLLSAVSTKSSEQWTLLPLMPYFDWAAGVSVLGAPDEHIGPWGDHRILIIRGLLAHSRKTSGPNALVTLSLEANLAFWLVCDRETDEAEALLRANHAAWARTLEPDDPWLDHLEAMLACCAVVRAHREGRAGGPIVVPDGAEKLLVDQWNALGSGPTDTLLRKLLGRTLVTLYGPELLNDPAKLARFQK